MGSEVWFVGDLEEAVNEGVKEAYVNHYLRKSMVKHPFNRVNTNDNTPAILHTKIVPGNKIKISVAPKGAGSENMSLVKMLTPSDGVEGVKNLVLKTIFESGGKPCPPLVVGIGIGGNLEKSALLAKEAVMRDISDESVDPINRGLEKEWLDEINKLGVGPMGFGGTVTALAVKINTYPCHVASLPVAINIQCHAARHKSIVL
jgi:fumarate hydratase subunit alpha